ncbi:unnamed protein product [Symbiodinium sp. CCMP2456]|nr:unnamed protein product [Symbiodinium sp. CCMP2456]
MLSKALPSVVYEQALANRNVTCVGLIFLTLRTFQPGGLNERAELLRGLTSLATFESATAGVGGMQKWFRHLERAKSMGISVPDSSLLLDSLDKALAGILQGNPSMNFRMHSVRMQLQLDTRPQLDTIEEFARTVLSELELLSVAMPDSAGGGKADPSPAPTAEGKPTATAKKPCTGQVNVGRVEGLTKKRIAPGGKGKGGAAAKAAAPQTSGLSQDAIKEAAQLLQSMRLAALKPYVRTATELLCRAHRGEPRGLIDGGELDLDSSSGCPEVSEGEALALIKEYESLVERNEHRSARLHCIMKDLETLSLGDLASLVVQRDTHADAAMQMLVTRIFPCIDRELLSQALVSLQDQDGEPFAWNRRMRRRCEQAGGILVHLFSSGCKRAYEGLADRSKLALLTVERPENLLSDSTFRYLLQQASRGRVKGIVGAMPYRTFAWTRYLKEGGEKFHRPLRVRGESLGDYGIQELNCREQAQRRMDDLLILRIVVLTVVATASSRAMHQEVPSVVLENPEDPQEDVRDGYPTESLSPPSIWAVPEWKELEKFADLQRVSFHQGALGHCKRRPTTLCINLSPDPVLLDCWTEDTGTDEGSRANVSCQQNWAGWAPGLQCTIGDMLWRAFREHAAGHDFKVRSVDAGFLEHLRNNHTPYRRDCKYCVQGGARQMQHRKVLAPQGWTLSVLSVPILSAEGSAVDEPADRDPLITVEGFAKGLEDREWFVSKGMELEEPLPEPSQRELKEAKESWNSWEKASREDWLREAKAEYLPKVEMVDILFTEAVETKKQQEVTAVVSRMYAQAISDGYDVRPKVKSMTYRKVEVLTLWRV